MLLPYRAKRSACPFFVRVIFLRPVLPDLLLSNASIRSIESWASTNPRPADRWKSRHMPSNALTSTHGVVRFFPVALPPGIGLSDGKNVLKERPLARGLSSSTAREGYGLAAGICAGAMPTSYVWTLSSLEPPAEVP
jgi:hypothetical protein